MNFLELLFIQRQRPLFLVSEVLSFPNYRARQLAGKASREARSRSLILQSLRSELVLGEIGVVRDVGLASLSLGYGYRHFGNARFTQLKSLVNILCCQ